MLFQYSRLRFSDRYTLYNVNSPRKRHIRKTLRVCFLFDETTLTIKVLSDCKLNHYRIKRGKEIIERSVHRWHFSDKKFRCGQTYVFEEYPYACLNLLNFVYIVVCDVETALDNVKLAIVLQIFFPPPPPKKFSWDKFPVSPMSMFYFIVLFVLVYQFHGKSFYNLHIQSQLKKIIAYSYSFYIDDGKPSCLHTSVAIQGVSCLHTSVGIQGVSCLHTSVAIQGVSVCTLQ